MLVQEHHLSHDALHVETIAMSELGHHVHGQNSLVRKREVGGVMVCTKSHLQARLAEFHDLTTGCGFVAVTLRISGFDLVLASLYLETESSFHGDVQSALPTLRHVQHKPRRKLTHPIRQEAGNV